MLPGNVVVLLVIGRWIRHVEHLRTLTSIINPGLTWSVAYQPLPQTSTPTSLLDSEGKEKTEGYPRASATVMRVRVWTCGWSIFCGGNGAPLNTCINKGFPHACQFQSCLWWKCQHTTSKTLQQSALQCEIAQNRITYTDVFHVATRPCISVGQLRMQSARNTYRSGQVVHKLGAPHDVIFRMGPLTVLVGHGAQINVFCTKLQRAICALSRRQCIQLHQCLGISCIATGPTYATDSAIETLDITWRGI
jgi:hypothetical protein